MSEDESSYEVFLPNLIEISPYVYLRMDATAQSQPNGMPSNGYNEAAIKAGMSDGVSATRTPAASRATRLL
jgi:hypothetical protein